MKKKKYFKHYSQFTEHMEELRIDVAKYADGKTVRVDLTCKDGEPYATLTRRLTTDADDDCGFVDTNNLGNEIVTELEEQGIAKLTGRKAPSGWCVYPEMRFDILKILKEYEN